MRALTLASSAATLLFLFLVLSHGVGMRGGMVSIAASAGATALFWWAVQATKHSPPHLAHTGDTPQMLHEAGPFAYVRHPFYLSYCIFWLGAAVAAGGLQWIAAVGLIGWYYATARAEEARFSQSPMAASYAGYQRRTGMLLPRIAQVWRR
ncbi:methyltransferase family protein [Roseomonas marmotae]|uniref:Isoprenylcysteine carboxylmethyltransferase family protein n=1 Tax=Roseomonas marmotae TaxID=2768161 RepID=A0ABS3K8J0_9PROT|nr:isoprenylcysteine carboxylmethyltransferase family protein [Roseomonas marmotae]MBO1073783.1 isoprenylcysteine carboxylmethyltransferase family protein [Roseomonas marmotae]QTI78587.1 isoprenylcysteine carboxylmethyltransferase family protein [Roseomonas marmotae]